MFKQNSGDYVLEYILIVWNNGVKNIKLDQTEFIDMCLLSGDSGFNMEVHTVKKNVKC